MATPMTAQQFVDALKKEGLTVSEKFSGWRTHERDDETGRIFGPVNGVVIHHTAGRDSLSLCYNGTSALPGPLCHTHLSKTGVATMISAGRANHAGGFTQNAHDAVVNESTSHPRPSGAEVVDGNDHYYGIEIENLGDGKDFYPQDQYDAAVKWAAAICRFHGWTAQSVIGHKEGTTRKIDPKGPVGKAGGPMWDMDQFRKDVQARLNKAVSKPAPAPAPAKPAPKPAPKPVSKIVALKDGVKPGATHSQVSDLQRFLIKAGYGPIKGAYTDYYGPETQKAVARFHNRNPHLRTAGKSYDPAIGKSGFKELQKEAGIK
ncbi:endolysin [Streptomyces phage Nishikigoi]|nr:endolysin [Streptomyces phage Nishikigoi]